MALSVIAVSISVSPFFTDEAATDMFMTSAPRRFPASSNDDCVRVDASKKRLICVRPLQHGLLLVDLPRNRDGLVGLVEKIDGFREATGRAMPSRWRWPNAGCFAVALIEVEPIGTARAIANCRSD